MNTRDQARDPRELASGVKARLNAKQAGLPHEVVRQEEIGWLADELRAALARVEAERARADRNIVTHEGMVTVYDEHGSYIGCMGKERWQKLLEEDNDDR